LHTYPSVRIVHFEQPLSESSSLAKVGIASCSRKSSTA
jgi:hypothetical protein